MRIARASGSCSACAIRSAAIHAGLPGRRQDGNLARAGEEVDRAVVRDERLRGRDVGIAGPDDAVDARDGGRAVGHGGDGVRAADPEQPRHARPRARRTSPSGPAAGTWRSLRARRRHAPGSPSSAATRAADSARQARSTRRGRAAATRCSIETPDGARLSTSWGAGRSATRRMLRAAHGWRGGRQPQRLRGALVDLVAVDLDRAIEAVEPPRVAGQRASPSRRTRSTMVATRRSSAGSLAGRSSISADTAAHSTTGGCG